MPKLIKRCVFILQSLQYLSCKRNNRGEYTMMMANCGSALPFASNYTDEKIIIFTTSFGVHCSLEHG